MHGEEIVFSDSSFQKRKSQNSGNHDQEGDALVGGGKECLGPLQMSDLALSWGAQSESWVVGPGVEVIPDSSKQGHQRKGDPSSWFQLWGVGRQVDKGHRREGRGGRAPP